MASVKQIGIRMEVDTQSVTTELPKASREFTVFGQAVEGASARATRSLADVRMSVRDLAAAGVGVTVLTNAVHGLVEQLTALPKKGFDFTKELEVSQTGMAGILSSMTAIEGKTTSYNQALAISSGMISKLNDDALRTAASSQELVTVFQALLAPGLAARMNLDQIRQLTVVGTNAVKSMGLAGNQVVQELRDLVAGGITAAGSSLATALGLKDEDIAKARASSEGLFNFLMKRLSGFDAGAQAFGDTLKGKLDQLQEGATRVAAAGMQPLTDAAKKALDQTAGLFLVIDQNKNVQLNPELVGTLQSWSEKLVSVGGALQTVTAFAWEHRSAISAIATVYGAIRMGRMISELVATAQASNEAAQASRLAAMQAAAQSQADTQAAMTTRQRAAALLAELEAQRAAAQAEVQATQAKIANLQATEQGIVAARADSVAKLQAAQSTIAQAQAQLQASQAAMAQAQAQLSAAQAAGALSYALAMAREATAALTAAQAGHAASSATLAAAQTAQAAATADLAMLGRQQAAVQASITAATAAQTVATNAATAATARLSAAQAAAGVAGRTMGLVLGALGGPVGIAIAAVYGLVMWLIKAKGAADDLAGENQKIARADANIAAGKPVESRDLVTYQTKLEKLKDKRDELLRDGPALGGNHASANAGKAKFAKDLAETEKQIAQYESQIKKAEDINSRAGSVALTLNPTAALQAFKKTLEGAKTKDAATQEYEDKKNAAQLALESFRASGGSAEEVRKAQKEYDDAVAAWAKERDRKIKEMNASAVSASNKSLSAQEEAIAQGYKRQAAVTADGLDAIDSLRKQGLISEGQAIQRAAALRMQDVDNERQALQARLALAKRKPDSAKEQETLRGQMEELAQKRKNIANKAERDLRELDAKPILEQVKAQEHATEAAWAAAEAQERQNAVFGRSKSSIQELIVAELERLRVQAEGEEYDERYRASLDKRIAAERRLSAALREQENKEITKKNDDKEIEEARRTAESASSTFRDSFVRTFESGGNLASAMYKSLKTTVMTAIADALFSATLKAPIESFALLLKSTLNQALGGGGGGGFGSLISSILGIGGGGWQAAGVQASGAVTAAVSGGGSVVGTALPMLASAKGNAFSGTAGISAYRNTVINRPTLFPFAKGVGLVGEAAGAPGEAIMPLTRTRDGRLGVAAMGGGQQAGGGQFVFSPTYNVDSRADRAAVIADMHEVASQHNQALVEQLQRVGAVPKG